jgi:hypothetical protein
MSEPTTARTYNQDHTPRPYTRGRRRTSVYVAWSYPAEANRDPRGLDNRFSTMTEVRRAAWPAYEDPKFSDPLRFQQGISGALELFFWAWVKFQRFVGEVTGHVVPTYQRVDQAGFPLPLDERVLGDTDTLLVYGLDHQITEQVPSAAEIEAVRAFLAREGTRLVICPHHEVGATDDLEQREIEYRHHGDPLVPRQQRFGLYTRGLMEGLGIPVQNRWALRPAMVNGKVAPLEIDADLDERGWLAGVENLNFHMHLPHYALTSEDPRAARVLARQPIDLSRPHPFVAQGNDAFNTFVWVPPNGDRAADVLVVDSTVFSTLFGADASLERFWKNLVTLP